MSLKLAIAKLSAAAAGVALLQGGAVRIAIRPRRALWRGRITEYPHAIDPRGRSAPVRAVAPRPCRQQPF